MTGRTGYDVIAQAILVIGFYTHTDRNRHCAVCDGVSARRPSPAAEGTPLYVYSAAGSARAVSRARCARSATIRTRSTTR